MPTYKTPGVYVEEISTLPQSVAEVSTAIPAFIGYTEKGPSVSRIDTFLDYQELFGGAKISECSVQVSEQGGLSEVASVLRPGEESIPAYLMYYCVNHYFKNGGGSCYIVSVGNYSDGPAVLDKAAFEKGLDLVAKEDEPTLLLLTDAINLPEASDYYDLCAQVLQQCNKLGDRFAVFDVKDGNIEEFRNKIGTSYLMYGAAYYPYLETTLTFPYAEERVSVAGLSVGKSVDSALQMISNDNGVLVKFEADPGTAAPTVKIVAAGETLGFKVSERSLKIQGVGGKKGTDVAAAWADWAGDPKNEEAGFVVVADGDGSAEPANTGGRDVELKPTAGSSAAATMAALKDQDTGFHNVIKTALAAERVTLPPSAAIAGIYASVDRDRGVWKAPANVSVSSVIGPVSKITHDQQESLNVDAKGGKSINAIRAFAGKGTLVWGARTLAGNDNEWRYVSVRRLFNMIEESCRKATAFAVFEPNDMTTWLKVKGMIEGYLYTLWEKGALAGAAPEAAYFVHVGLGKTMTAQDVLEGRMIIEIGIAAVRPAEFIVLRFSHKLQEA